MARQQMCGRCGLTLNRRILTKPSTSGENDSGPLWRPKESTLNTCCGRLQPTVCCLDASFQTIFKCFSYFRQHSILCMIDSISVPIVTLCLLYTCYVQLQITRPMHYVYKNILLLKQCSWRCASKLQESGFLTDSVVSVFTVGINSKSFLWPVHYVQETSSNSLRRPT